MHAHIASAASDCDGRVSSEYVITKNDGEDEIDFHTRIVSLVVNTYSFMSEATLKVTRFEDGDVRILWSEPTEEGFRETEATICTDDCDPDHHSYSDLYAEMSGY